MAHTADSSLPLLPLRVYVVGWEGEPRGGGAGPPQETYCRFLFGGMGNEWREVVWLNGEFDVRDVG